MATMRQLGVTAIVELPPAGTLVGLARRELSGVELLALKTPDQLAAAQALLAAHGYLAPEPAPAWRVVVAPVGGTFVPAAVEPGSRLDAGASIGTVTARGRVEQVVAVHGGALVEWLAEPDDPVTPGQPLARLHPEGASV
jgi:[acyl-carrier-protein] S-malonyltransferase